VSAHEGRTRKPKSIAVINKHGTAATIHIRFIVFTLNFLSRSNFAFTCRRQVFDSLD
jgi:hypothetical protein